MNRYPRSRGRPKGLVKTGGRKKGVANKRTREVVEAAERQRITPLELQLRTMRELWSRAHANGEMDIALAEKACQIARDCAVYIHPKLSTVTATIETVHTMSGEVRALRLAQAFDRLDRLALIEAMDDDDAPTEEVDAVDVVP